MKSVSLALADSVGPLGSIEVAQARTSSDEISSEYVVVITLSNKQRMGLFLPRNVAHLPRDLAGTPKRVLDSYIMKLISSLGIASRTLTDFISFFACPRRSAPVPFSAFHSCCMLPCMVLYHVL